MRLPIDPHHVPQASFAERAAVEALARTLIHERPDLALPEAFRSLVPASIEDSPALVLDDLSELRHTFSARDSEFIQDRARLRAGDGDFVAALRPAVEGYEEYCCQRLGLGSVTWLAPAPGADPTQLALACWEDRGVRRALIRAIRAGKLRYVHPHMGSLGAWELAALLRSATRRPVEVIGPGPGLCRWVNDKASFASTVARLFGPELLPLTHEVSGFAWLAHRTRELAECAVSIGIKLPDAAGGGGNLVLDAGALRGRSLREVDRVLREALTVLQWSGQCRLVVTRWEGEVLSAPSAQLWLPPPGEGEPMVEGLFCQTIVGQEGRFVGSHPAALPPTVTQQIVDHCWLLGLLYQRLGYRGRCSFDTILVGSDLEHCQLELIECNGRWGGTSLPMTLVNRLLGDWTARPYATNAAHARGLEQRTFADLLTALGDDLYDHRSGRGSYVLYNPARMTTRSGIEVIALADEAEAAQRLAQDTFPELLRGFAAG